MIEYDLRQRAITADQLLKVLEAGNNIVLTKVDECTLRIDSTGGGGGNSTGIKYHLKSADNITVEDCFEYFIACDFILDAGAMFTIDQGGRLVVHDGPIINDGVITNNGVIKNGLS